MVAGSERPGRGRNKYDEDNAARLGRRLGRGFAKQMLDVKLLNAEG